MLFSLCFASVFRPPISTRASAEYSPSWLSDPDIGYCNKPGTGTTDRQAEKKKKHVKINCIHQILCMQTVRECVCASICVRAGFVRRCRLSADVTAASGSATASVAASAADCIDPHLVPSSLHLSSSPIPQLPSPSVLVALTHTAVQCTRLGLSIYFRRLPESINRNLHFCIICKLNCFAVE